MNKLPILILAFNRADLVKQSMAPIRQYRPERLYLACDGPRENKIGEDKAVEVTRKVMEELIDWPCEVFRLYRETNLGCAYAVNDAITWFFSNEEYGCIIEDDVVVGQDFFTLCEDLLPRYIMSENIMEISARNVSRRTDIKNTYVYSQCYHCWGWATWRRAWNKMDMSMNAVNNHNVLYYIKRLGLFRGILMNYYFKKAYSRISTFNSWATRWYLSILDNDGLVICPGVNLAINIGMQDGTHYGSNDEDPYSGLAIAKIQWPLVYNDNIVSDIKQTYYDSIEFYRIRALGIKKKFRNVFK